MESFQADTAEVSYHPEATDEEAVMGEDAVVVMDVALDENAVVATDVALAGDTDDPEVGLEVDDPEETIVVVLDAVPTARREHNPICSPMVVVVGYAFQVRSASRNMTPL